ncbi:MAG TPA: pyridoxine 5'-phosphate synthase [Nitrospirae bacterium]|nr:pyridoxine 5'-phosphate synthase [Nitrospirota bacterium]HDL20071.1 pyridoxine 5'-phosphate synthase [Nitrospirota bacterium]HDZ00296.1 pyridoxine 5'-phosphate synthase [Nitrospirota bacterium]
MILGVNVDHVATVREARKVTEPDPVIAAGLAIRGGADGITVHLREDRRHIQDRDLTTVRRKVSVELNLEMAATGEMIKIALKVKPDMVTLVPEKRVELTTEGGLDLIKGGRKIKKAIDEIHGRGIPVSLFINPSVSDVEMSKELGAQMVEIHTGLYANAKGKKQTEELNRVKKAVKKGIDIGLGVNAGHGLNFTNVKRIAAIRGIRGLYIGHSIVSNSIYMGMEKAVKEMKRLIREGSKGI